MTRLKGDENGNVLSGVVNKAGKVVGIADWAEGQGRGDLKMSA